MAQITSNQHSYSSAYAMLNVSATAKRTGANTVSVRAEWEIVNGGSSALSNATRYLVLYVGSESGEMYFSPAPIRSGAWTAGSTYSGSVTFEDVLLDPAATSIVVGFGVSNSDYYMNSGDTLIWNGQAKVQHSQYDPDIQFGTITGIAQGYTACAAPTVFSVSPDVFKEAVELVWDGAEGGINNGITGYEIEYATSADGGTWGQWWPVTVAEDSPVSDTPGIELGTYQKFRIRAQGSAGADYYSEWVESNPVRKAKPVVYIHNGTETKTYGAYIYDGAQKKRYTPYRWDGSKWVQVKH